MADSRALLALLQHGDSAFPSGSVAFSYGLETLCQDAEVQDANDVEDFLHDQLRNRWATLERTVLLSAWRDAQDLERLGVIDNLVEEMTLPSELRNGSKRAGGALLSAHRRLDTPGAAALTTAIRAGDCHGHLCVVQGVVWRGVGLGSRDAELISTHTFCSATLAAALRLGIIGHISVQSILNATHAVIAALLDTPPLPEDQLHAYTPVADIAAMRHETQQSRLFSN